jgi:D-serine deaminase-like pyridoxal phosphate-dependent protein
MSQYRSNTLNIQDLETPCLLLDINKLEHNISFLHRRMKELGVNLRPHGKTAKNIDVMRMSLKGQSGGITVSTIKEAEYYFEQGITDLVYAVGIAPSKLDRIAGLVGRGAEITVILDSVEQIKFLSARAQQYGLTIPALIELDCDGHRSGVTLEDPALLEIARLLNSEPGVSLSGVLTHAGESYHCESVEEIRTIAHQERDVAVGAAEILRRNGLPCPIVSVGSTPTATFASDLAGVTEVRAGVFLFQDLVMAGLGVCSVTDISVLATVIGHQKQKGWVIIDAGWTALSSDRGTASQRIDQGYGLVCSANGEPLSNMIVSITNQEHGIIVAREGGEVDWNSFAIGSLVRVLPNHACAMGTMHDHYHVINETGALSHTLPRVNGW